MSYNYKDHLPDYIKMSREIKELIRNHKQEPEGVTLEQLKYRLNFSFSDKRIEELSK